MPRKAYTLDKPDPKKVVPMETIIHHPEVKMNPDDAYLIEDWVALFVPKLGPLDPETGKHDPEIFVKDPSDENSEWVSLARVLWEEQGKGSPKPGCRYIAAPGLDFTGIEELCPGKYPHFQGKLYMRPVTVFYKKDRDSYSAKARLPLIEKDGIRTQSVPCVGAKDREDAFSLNTYNVYTYVTALYGVLDVFELREAASECV